MILDEQQIKELAPKEAAFKAGKKLSTSGNWKEKAISERAIWGAVQGSGKNPYLVQIDTQNLAYKCSCPSRQFPCKHALGLLLLHSSSADSFVETPEPEHVSEWIDKREARSQKVDKEEKELSEEEKAKKEKAKAKRSDDKMKLVKAGISELKSWVKDLIQLGILELPNRPETYFSTMEKRMVDSKLPGLAGWIRGLKNLDYKNQASWQDQAMSIISKMYLLISAAEKLDTLEGSEKQHIESLLGFTLKKDAILADKETITIKDKWLILGNTIEEQEDIKIKRYWLYGLESKKDAIVIRFDTRFSGGVVEVPLLSGSILEAELAFYPSTLPHRAFVKKDKEVTQNLENKPQGISSWSDFQKVTTEQTKSNPWINNHSYIIDNVKIVRDGKDLIVVDKDSAFMKINRDFAGDQRSTLILLSNNESINISFVQKPDGIYPLGIFKPEEYLVL